MRSMVFPALALFLAKSHLQGPVQEILDGPMLPHRPQRRSDRGLQAANSVTALDRSPLCRLPEGADLHLRLQPDSLLFGPQLVGRQVVQTVQVGNCPALLGFDASVALVQGPGVVMGEFPIVVIRTVLLGRDEKARTRGTVGRSYLRSSKEGKSVASAACYTQLNCNSIQIDCPRGPHFLC